MTTGYPPTKTQMLWNILSDLEERTDQAHLPVFRDALREALELLREIDPDADWNHGIPEGASLGR